MYLKTFLLCTTVTVTAFAVDTLSLKEAERLALKQNNESIALDHSLESEKWRYRNALSGYLPTADYNLQYTRLDCTTVKISNAIMDSIGIPIKNNPRAALVNSFEHEITLNQPLINGGAEILAIKISRHLKEAQAYSAKADKAEIISDTRKAYYNTISAKKYMEVIAEELEWIENELEKAMIKYDKSLISIADLLDWKSQKADKEVELFEADSKYKMARHNLFQVIGFDENNTGSIKLMDYAELEAAFPEKCPDTQDDINSNYTLLALNEYTKIAELKKRIELSDFLPSLNSFLSYSWQKSEDFIPDTRSIAFGGKLKVPLFHGFQDFTDYKAKKEDYLKTLFKEKETISRIRVQLKQTQLSLKEAHASALAYRKKMELLKKNENILKTKYDAGLIDQSRYIEIVLGLKKARAGYINKVAKYLTLWSQYQLQTGKMDPNYEKQ